MADELKVMLPSVREPWPYVAWDGVSGRTVALTLCAAASPVSIGRGARMDIVLAADPAVSLLHAELTCVSGEWLLVDDGLSRNGSYVNGSAIRGRHRLRHADQMRLGHSELVFHRPREVVAIATGPPGPPPHAHRTLLAKLAAPLRADPRALPATDTEIAYGIDAPLPLVRHALTELCLWYGLADPDHGRGRAQLAAAALSLGHAESAP
jgi:predicted component of type VI protein secretion system